MSLISLGSLDPLEHAEGISYAGLVSDWEVVEAADQAELLRHAQQKHLIVHCASLVRLALMLEEVSSTSFVLKEVEQTLEIIGDHSTILNELLVAPFKEKKPLSNCASFALENGLGSSASLLHRLYDLQPVLSRFSNIWMNLPSLLTSELGCSKEEQWFELVQTGYLVKILEAENIGSIRSIFGNLAFDRSVPKERTGLAHLGKEIGELLFVSSSLPEMERDVSDETDYRDPRHREGSHASPQEELKRALTEIDSIAHELAKGKDDLAFRYLDDLLDRQVAELSVEYAVKSLCNIAKRCADMFRTDFEALCIRRARELDPLDTWAQIQLGDHLKRVGKYEEAEKVVSEVQDHEDKDIAPSLLADIASVRGEMDLAIDRYKNISGWKRSPSILTAIADNYRRKGEYDEALTLYTEIEEKGYARDRAQSGKAQILLRQGHLNEALSIYESILGSSIEDKSRTIYQITYANLLKQAGRIDDAALDLEKILEKHPFMMRARVLRSSLYALKDELTLANNILPASNNQYSYNAFGEWVTEYTRGLLLLRSDQYSDAKEKLVRNYSESVLESEEKEVLRLASALSVLAVGDTSATKELLGGTTLPVKNSYLEYLRTVLEFHTCVLEKNAEKADKLYEILHQKKADNIILWDAVQALREGEPEKAISIEIRSMLQFAA